MGPRNWVTAKLTYIVMKQEVSVVCICVICERTNAQLRLFHMYAVLICRWTIIKISPERWKEEISFRDSDR